MLKTENFVNAFSYVRSAVSTLTSDEKALYRATCLMCDISISLVEYRRKNKLSQEQLAEKLGVGQSMISKYESGTYNWSIRSLSAVSSKLGLDLTLSIDEKEMTPKFGEGIPSINSNVCEMPSFNAA